MNNTCSVCHSLISFFLLSHINEYDSSSDLRHKYMMGATNRAETANLSGELVNTPSS